MLTIGAHRFDIAHAELRAYVSIGGNGWGVSWDLEIRTHPRDIDGVLQPRLHTHGSLVGLPHPRDLAGTRFGPFGLDKDDEPVFLLYLFEHDPVDNVVLAFGERRNSDFSLTLTATTTNYDGLADEDEDVVPVALECWVTFAGVVVDEHHLENARVRLAQFFGEFGWDHAEEGVRHVFRLSSDT
jgi:hypothetical protein